MKSTRYTRRGRREREAYLKRLRIWVLRIFFMCVAGVLVIWLGHQIYFFYLVHAIKTEKVIVDFISARSKAQAIVLRHEAVVKSPGNGKLVQIVKEGQRVRTGTVVACLQRSEDLSDYRREIKLISPKAGVVCYHIDGWEGVLVPDNWQRLNLAEMFNNDDFVKRNVPYSLMIDKGEHVFKIIDNLVNPYLILKMDDSNLLNFRVGDLVELKWENTGAGKGKVISYYRNRHIAVIEVIKMNGGLPCSRVLKLEIIGEKYYGAILPVTSLVKNRTEIGVFVLTPLGVHFKEIELIGKVGKYVAVNGINPGTEVVVNPNVAKKLESRI